MSKEKGSRETGTGWRFALSGSLILAIAIFSIPSFAYFSIYRGRSVDQQARQLARELTATAEYFTAYVDNVANVLPLLINRTEGKWCPDDDSDSASRKSQSEPEDSGCSTGHSSREGQGDRGPGGAGGGLECGSSKLTCDTDREYVEGARTKSVRSAHEAYRTASADYSLVESRHSEALAEFRALSSELQAAARRETEVASAENRDLAGVRDTTIFLADARQGEIVKGYEPLKAAVGADRSQLERRHENLEELLRQLDEKALRKSSALTELIEARDECDMASVEEIERAAVHSILQSRISADLAEPYRSVRLQVSLLPPGEECHEGRSYKIDDQRRLGVVSCLSKAVPYYEMTAYFPISAFMSAAGEATSLDGVFLVDDADGVILARHGAAAREIGGDANLIEGRELQAEQGSLSRLFSYLSASFNPRPDFPTRIGAGVEYYVLEHDLPLVLANGGTSGKRRLRLIGLRNVTQFDAGAAAIPSRWLAVSVIGLVLVLLALPALRLLALGPGDYVRATELAVAAASTLLFVAFSVIAVAYVDYQDANRRALVGATEGFWNRIHSDFDEELGTVLGLIEDEDLAARESIERLLGERHCESVGRRDGDFAQNLPIRELVPPPQLCAGPVAEHGETYGDTLRCECRPYFSSAVRAAVDRRDTACESINTTIESIWWIDPWGWPLDYGSDRCTAHVSVPNLSRRNYVSRLRDAQAFYYEPNPDEKGDEVEFILDRFLSWRDGFKETAISVFSAADTVHASGIENRAYRTRRSTGVVATAFVHLESLAMSRPNPELGFAVVEPRTGNILFASDDQASLVENFFDQIGPNEVLRSMVGGLTRGTVSANISGGPAIFYTGRLPHTDLALVTHVTTAPADDAAFFLLIFSTLQIAFYGFVLGLLFWWRLRHGIPAWFWPDPSFHTSYYRASLVLAALVGFSGVIEPRSVGEWLGQATDTGHLVALGRALASVLWTVFVLCSVRFAYGIRAEPDTAMNLRTVATGVAILASLCLTLSVGGPVDTAPGAATALVIIFAFAGLLTAVIGYLGGSWRVGYCSVVVLVMAAAAIPSGRFAIEDARDVLASRIDSRTLDAGCQDLAQKRESRLQRARRFAGALARRQEREQDCLPVEALSSNHLGWLADWTSGERGMEVCAGAARVEEQVSDAHYLTGYFSDWLSPISESTAFLVARSVAHSRIRFKPPPRAPGTPAQIGLILATGALFVSLIFTVRRLAKNLFALYFPSRPPDAFESWSQMRNAVYVGADRQLVSEMVRAFKSQHPDRAVYHLKPGDQLDGAEYADRLVVIHLCDTWIESPDEQEELFALLDAWGKRRHVGHSSGRPYFALLFESEPDRALSSIRSSTKRAEWRRLLARFVRVSPLPPEIGVTNQAHASAFDALRAEREAWPELAPELDRAAYELENRAFRESRDVVLRLSRLAEPFYGEKWERLNKDEKLLLYNLASNHYCVSRPWPALLSLYERGLVVRSPHFVLRSDAFGEFVLQRGGRENIASHRVSGQGTLWALVQAPLIALVAVASLLLLSASGDALEAAIPLLAAAVTAFPQIFDAVRALAERDSRDD